MAPIHCKRTTGEQVYAKFLKICSEKQIIIYILADLRVSNWFDPNLHFWVNKKTINTDVLVPGYSSSLYSSVFFSTPSYFAVVTHKDFL